MVTSEGKLSRLVLGFVLILLGGTFCVGPAPCAQVGATDQKPASGTAAPSAKDGSKLKELLKERLATARQLAAQTTEAYKVGASSFDRVHQATLTLLHAELDLCESDKDRIAVLEKIVARTKANEEIAVARHKVGNAPQADALLAQVGRLEAEIALERAHARPTTRLPGRTQADEAEVFNVKASPQFVHIVDVQRDVVEVDKGEKGALRRPGRPRFTVVLSKQFYVDKLQKVEVEKDGKKVVEEKRVGFMMKRELYTLELFLHDFRLTDAGGKDVDWGKAKGKVVLLNWSSQEIDPVYTRLLAKDSIILSKKK